MARVKEIVTCIIYDDFDIKTGKVVRHKAAWKEVFRDGTGERTN